MQSILLDNSTARSRHPSQTSSESSASASDSNHPSRTIRFAPLPNPRKDEESAVFYPDDSDSDTPSLSSATIECPPSPRFSLKATFPKSKTSAWSNLLRPLFKSNTNNTIQDDSDSAYKVGVPLSRRRSTGCNSIASTKEIDRASVYRDGAPLTHTNSDSATRRAAASNYGHRMLNGRVYGRRSDYASLHSESYEPDFVEWGYGGMGSVSNSVTRDPKTRGVDWAKVQSSGKFIDGNNSDPDDGSGMQWVRRRREQREREKRERERERERENFERQIIPEIAIHPPHDVGQHDEGSAGRDEQHVYQAINIPAPHQHHSHHRHNKSIHGSAHSSANLPTSSDTGLQTAGSTSETSVNGNSSGAEDEENNDDDTERDLSDDDGDEVEEVLFFLGHDRFLMIDCFRLQTRITSKGAGVEKISRHKD